MLIKAQQETDKSNSFEIENCSQKKPFEPTEITQVHVLVS